MSKPLTEEHRRKGLELYEKMGIPNAHPDVELLRRSLRDNP